MKGAGELVQVARMSFVQPDTVESKSDVSQFEIREILRSLTLGNALLLEPYAPLRMPCTWRGFGAGDRTRMTTNIQRAAAV